MSFNIEVEGGTSVRLHTAGKYCDRDIVVTATGGGGGSEEEWFNDGNTHLWIHLEEGRTSPMLGIGAKGVVTIDWGDGTEPDVRSFSYGLGTVQYTNNHNYAAPGDYVITLKSDGEIGIVGSSSGSCILVNSSGTSNAINAVYRNGLKKVELGTNVTSISKYAFNSCYALQQVKVPNTISFIGESAFTSCYTLASIPLPESIEAIYSYAFSNCYRLAPLTIPGGVTSIGISAFASCYSARYYDFSNHTAVPTLTNQNAFNKIPADCEIRVPAALYDEWIAATNWATYASQIVAV